MEKQIKWVADNEDTPTSDYKPEIEKDTIVLGSQECVGDRGSRSNPAWATVRAAHQNPHNNRIPPGGRAHKLTYAQAVAE